MRLLILTSALFFSTHAMAIESGFIYEGKEYTVYKDGKKVGKEFNEQFPNIANRKPNANIAVDETKLYYFLIDGNIKCYRNHAKSEILSCVKFQ